MPAERKTDLRVIKTKEAIYSTFKKMICEMDADKITIRELTDRARIHYKTLFSFNSDKILNACIYDFVFTRYNHSRPHSFNNGLAPMVKRRLFKYA